jgi:XTP/dITP diphosphohydrolase
MPTTHWVLATTNPNKVQEVREIVAAYGITLQSLADYSVAFEEPVEDGASFEENARIKALSYAIQLGQTVLAEDSGLEVDALAGAPGVHSARYAGSDGSREMRDAANNEKLLSELADVPTHQRTARFVCALCVATPSGQVLAEARGSYEGRIGFEARGSNGFGYDPLLYLPDLGCTSAELTPAQKNARSHRGIAVLALLERYR